VYFDGIELPAAKAELLIPIFADAFREMTSIASAIAMY
jgi:hypothetical protein